MQRSGLARGALSCGVPCCVMPWLDCDQSWQPAHGSKGSWAQAAAWHCSCDRAPRNPGDPGSVQGKTQQRRVPAHAASFIARPRVGKIAGANTQTRPFVRQDAGPAGALLERDSDSDEDGELEPYDEDADRWDDEDDVSPEDERALAAFMVQARREQP